MSLYLGLVACGLVLGVGCLAAGMITRKRLSVVIVIHSACPMSKAFASTSAAMCVSDVSHIGDNSDQTVCMLRIGNFNAGVDQNMFKSKKVQQYLS